MPGGTQLFPQKQAGRALLAQERTLWAAVVALEEGASLSRQLTEQLGSDLRQALEEEAQDRLQQAKELRRILEQRKSFPLD